MSPGAIQFGAHFRALLQRATGISYLNVDRGACAREPAGVRSVKRYYSGTVRRPRHFRPPSPAERITAFRQTH